MIATFFLFLCVYCSDTTCAFGMVRYSTSMQDMKQLPQELSTCHEVILVQSAAITGLANERDQLKHDLAESYLAYKKLLEGHRREKYINPDQGLLEFPEDKELQAVLEAAKREAEAEIEKITYTRTKRKKDAKPKSGSFPAHLRREEIVAPLVEADQKLADQGREVIRQLIRESLAYVRPEVYVKAYFQLMLNEEPVAPAATQTQEPSATNQIAAPSTAPISKETLEQLRNELPASLGEQGRFDASIVAAVACGKFEHHIPYYRQQDMFSSNGWTPGRSTLDYTMDLMDEAVQELPKLMARHLHASQRIGMDMTKEERTDIRQRESKLILNRLGTWLDGPMAKDVLPASKLGQAFQYLRNHWGALCEYVKDGGLPIDNNWVERLMKRVACGRKNWLFVGSMRAGIRNANIMTLVGSTHRHDLDVQMYLEDVINHMNRGTAKPEDLLPDVWKQSHPEAVRSYRTEERRDKAELARLRTSSRKARP